MPSQPFQFRSGAIHIPEIGLWLDPHDRVTGPERVFVSHAHSDHTARHREVILSEPTGLLMKRRIGGERLEHRLPFRTKQQFTWADRTFDLTLLPAGHILGSAMALVEWDGRSLLYTGDFKLRPGRSAEPCDVSAARGVELLIMETTFGRPQYEFPPTDAVMKGIVRFCREALDNDEVPVLLGYSLGKSQELLCGLAEAGLPVLLHRSVERLTRVYEQLGHRFPAYDVLTTGDSGPVSGKVLICPPQSAGPEMRRALGRTRTAVLTGWAVDPNCRFRYRADAAFPLSDHADFPDLIRFVQQVSPRRVFTLHGFAADFADTLRHLGFEAHALSESDQLTLPLSAPTLLTPPSGIKRAWPQVSATTPAEAQTEAASRSDSFARFANTCAAMTDTPNKLAKVDLLARYLRPLASDDGRVVMAWLGGRSLPTENSNAPRPGWAMVRDALCHLSPLKAEAIRQIYLQHSDAGETVFEILQHQPRAVVGVLTLTDVQMFLQGFHAAAGPSRRLGLLVETLKNCSAGEARVLVKILTGDLRVGLNRDLIEKAVASASELSVGGPCPGERRAWRHEGDAVN